MRHGHELTAWQPAMNAVLVNRARSGDREAFADLYSVYRAEVFRYLFRRLRDRHLAEDLTSETFLRALRSIETFRWTGQDISAWLVTIAHNLLVDHYTCSRHRLEILVTDVDLNTSARLAPSAEEHVVDAMQERFKSDLVRRTLATMPSHWQGAVMLRYWSDWHDPLIAKYLGLPNAGAVRATRFRAMCSMRKSLSPLKSSLY